MVKTITFIRHAHTENGHLSSKGKSQSRKRSTSLSKISFDLLVISTALRAKETATYIQEKQKNSLDSKEVEELFLPLDPFHKKGVEKLLKKVGKGSLKSYFAQDENGSFHHYIQESYHSLSSIINRYFPTHLLVVAHATIINALGLLYAPYAKELNEIYFDHSEGFTLDLEEEKIDFYFNESDDTSSTL